MKTVHTIQRYAASLIVFVLTTASYVLGIGGISLVLRSLGIRLIDVRADGSSWSMPTGSADNLVMY